MDIDDIRCLCLSYWSSEETTPFGPDILVYKLHGKIFAIVSLLRPFKISLKCEPEKAVSLRERYKEIVPGYHLNKRHWNTVDVEGNLTKDLIIEMVNDSYSLIFKSLPKKIQIQKQ